MLLKLILGSIIFFILSCILCTANYERLMKYLENKVLTIDMERH